MAWLESAGSPEAGLVLMLQPSNETSLVCDIMGKDLALAAAVEGTRHSKHLHHVVLVFGALTKETFTEAGAWL